MVPTTTAIQLYAKAGGRLNRGATEHDEHDRGDAEEDAGDEDADEDERTVGSVRLDQRAHALEGQVGSDVQVLIRTDAGPDEEHEQDWAQGPRAAARQSALLLQSQPLGRATHFYGALHGLRLGIHRDT